MRSVLVAGAGIGGLAVANGLARAGWKVRLVEKAPAHSPVGAGIVLAANAVRSLRQLGVDVEGHGYPLQRMDVTDPQGNTLQTANVGEYSQAWGATVALHRHHLHDALAAGLPKDVEVAHGVTVAALNQVDGGVEVATSDGRTERHDVVVGSDGIHSQVRALLLGSANGPLRYSGYTCWRTVCPNVGVEQAVEMWGHGARVGLVPLKDGQLYIFLVLNAPKGAPNVAFPHGLQAAFAEFGGVWPQALAKLEASSLLHHDLQDQPDIQWGQGRVWLLGDASHAMLPNQGQGAAMAIEDALVTSRLLARPNADAAAVHGEYVRLRHARVERVHKDSHRFGILAQLENPLGVWLRNALIKATPASVGRNALRAVVEPGIHLVENVA